MQECITVKPLDFDAQIGAAGIVGFLCRDCMRKGEDGDDGFLKRLFRKRPF